MDVFAVASVVSGSLIGRWRARARVCVWVCGEKEEGRGGVGGLMMPPSPLLPFVKRLSWACVQRSFPHVEPMVNAPREKDRVCCFERQEQHIVIEKTQYWLGAPRMQGGCLAFFLREIKRARVLLYSTSEQD